MNAPLAKVIECSGREALVRPDSAACPRCAAGKGCGAGLLGRGRPAALVSVRVSENLPVAAGQKVTLAIGNDSLLRGSLYLYGAPLLGLLIATGLSFLLAPEASDGIASLCAAAGLLAGGWTGAILARRDRCLASLMPTIVAVVDAKEQRQ